MEDYEKKGDIEVGYHYYLLFLFFFTSTFLHAIFRTESKLLNVK
jgi:hypothetical protein